MIFEPPYMSSVEKVMAIFLWLRRPDQNCTGWCFSSILGFMWWWLCYGL